MLTHLRPAHPSPCQTWQVARRRRSKCVALRTGKSDNRRSPVAIHLKAGDAHANRCRSHVRIEKERQGKNTEDICASRYESERVYGVSNADLRATAKTIKGRQKLACELYETGNIDAMYLSGLVADGSKLTKTQLNKWAKSAAGLQMISEYTVPWLAVENSLAQELALERMHSKDPAVPSSGWCTYSGLLSLKADEALDLKEIQILLGTVTQEIEAAPNRVKLSMNSFVIAVGTYVKPLLEEAKATAKQVSAVKVDMGETACKIPLATACIEKIKKTG